MNDKRIKFIALFYAMIITGAALCVTPLFKILPENTYLKQ
jgi:hypothetical protein